MRKSTLLLFVIAAGLNLAGCDKSEPADRASTVAPAPETTESAEPAEVDTAPVEPDDGAEEVALDEVTGWPEVLVEGSAKANVEPKTKDPATTAEAKAPAKAAKRRLRAKPRKSTVGTDDVTIDLFGDTKMRASKAKEMSRGSGDDRFLDDGNRESLERAHRNLLGPDVDEELEIPTLDRKSRAKVRRRMAPPGPSTDDGSDGLLLDDDRGADHGWQGRVDPSLRGPKTRAVDEPAETGKLSTFAIDVDTGSYSLSMGRMRRGYPPRSRAIRIEEWLNTFYYDNPVPDGESFAIEMEAAPNPFLTDKNEHLLRINIAGKSVSNEDRPAAHLTFVIDVSGSMFGPDKLDLIKESLTLLVSKLRPDDTVGIVTYAKGTEVVLWPTAATEKEKILGAVSRLEPGGSTALDEGLKLGYALAFRESHYNEGDIHRVVLLGDGNANVGARNVGSLLGPIQNAVDKGVTLSTIGFGAKAFNDELMEQLANRGNGNYAFIDSYRDARRVFGEQLCGTLHVIGKDAKIQVEFNTDRVKSWELLGYDNRALANEDFRDDDVDAGEIGAGHQVTALYRIVLDEDASGPLATARFRWEDPESGDVTEIEEALEEVVDDMREASDDFKFAASVAATADIFKKQTFTAAVNSGLIREIASEGVGADQPERREFVELLSELEPFMKK